MLTGRIFWVEALIVLIISGCYIQLLWLLFCPNTLRKFKEDMHKDFSSLRTHRELYGKPSVFENRALLAYCIMAFGISLVIGLMIFLPTIYFFAHLPDIPYR